MRGDELQPTAPTSIHGMPCIHMPASSGPSGRSGELRQLRRLRTLLIISSATASCIAVKIRRYQAERTLAQDKRSARCNQAAWQAGRPPQSSLILPSALSPTIAACCLRTRQRTETETEHVQNELPGRSLRGSISLFDSVQPERFLADAISVRILRYKLGPLLQASDLLVV